MGRLVPAKKGDEVSQMSEAEFWEWMEKQGVRDIERGDVGKPPHQQKLEKCSRCSQCFHKLY